MRYPDLVHLYYKEIKNRTSNVESDKINLAINELNYEDIEENFKPIDDPFKAPGFIELDNEASVIWNNFQRTAIRK